MRDAVQRLVDGLLDTMLSGPQPADFVRDFAMPLPSLVICDVLGVPSEDHHFFQENSAVLPGADATPEQLLRSGDGRRRRRHSGLTLGRSSAGRTAAAPEATSAATPASS